MTHFVVAIEYLGEDLVLGAGGARVPVQEHAFDLDTGLLAHDSAAVRVGFPEPTRSWTEAGSAPSCRTCDACVLDVLGERIRRQLRTARRRAGAPSTRWVWLYPPDLAPQP